MVQADAISWVVVTCHGTVVHGHSRGREKTGEGYSETRSARRGLGLPAACPSVEAPPITTMDVLPLAIAAVVFGNVGSVS